MNREINLANIYGRTNLNYNGYYYSYSDNYNDNLVGTSNADNIYGVGGNDTIWAGAGNDVIDAGTGNDIIRAYSPNWQYEDYWGNDTVYGGTGADFFDYSSNYHGVTLYGDNTSYSAYDGVDYMVGGFGQDMMYGGDGRDYLYGGDGYDFLYGDLTSNSGSDNDYLHGGAGTDELYGGGGDDRLEGGTGYDWLHGGPGNDIFGFHSGDTGATYYTSDVIRDFKLNEDWIDGDVRGTESNFTAVDQTINYPGFDGALAYANIVLYGNRELTYVAISDGSNSYLFADYSGDGTADAAVEIVGMTSVENRLAYWDII
jgi:Ca2+-binding RTX toxin-like protein